MLSEARLLAGEGTAAERALWAHLLACTHCTRARYCLTGQRLGRRADLPGETATCRAGASRRAPLVVHDPRSAAGRGRRGGVPKLAA